MTNSITTHLGAESKAATLLAMRSARKEIILVVEGDEDISLFSNALGLPRSNMLSCDGKEVLMELYAMVPSKGLDDGTVFIRDRDCDSVANQVSHDVVMVVSEYYDIEMDLLIARLYRRIFNEYAKLPHDDPQADQTLTTLGEVAAAIGALRLISASDELNLDFKELKVSKFLDVLSLKIDVKRMVEYVCAKSHVQLDVGVLASRVEAQVASGNPLLLVRGKDFIAILGVALARHFKFCPVHDCTADLLMKIVRIGATAEDIAQLSFFPHFKAAVEKSAFEWVGSPLP